MINPDVEKKNIISETKTASKLYLTFEVHNNQVHELYRNQIRQRALNGELIYLSEDAGFDTTDINTAYIIPIDQEQLHHLSQLARLHFLLISNNSEERCAITEILGNMLRNDSLRKITQQTMKELKECKTTSKFYSQSPPSPDLQFFEIVLSATSMQESFVDNLFKLDRMIKIRCVSQLMLKLWTYFCENNPQKQNNATLQLSLVIAHDKNSADYNTQFMDFFNGIADLRNAYICTYIERIMKLNRPFELHCIVGQAHNKIADILTNDKVQFEIKPPSITLTPSFTLTRQQLHQHYTEQFKPK